MDTNNNLLPLINRHEFLPVLRYGRFSGPGYAGGLGLESQFTRQDGTTIAVKDLVSTLEGLREFMQAQVKVKPIDFIDAVTRNHDIGYTVAEVRFLTKVQELYGKPFGDLTNEEKSSDQYKALEQRRTQDYWEADKEMLHNVVAYNPGPEDLLGATYRDSMIIAFYNKAASGVLGYGYKEAANTYFEDVLAKIDPRIQTPGFLASLGTLGKVSVLGQANYEDLAVLPLTNQEKQFFIQHLDSFNYLQVGNTSPNGSVLSPSELDYQYRLIVPVEQSKGIWVATATIGGKQVQMTLNKTDTTNPIFTRTVSEDGKVISTQIITVDSSVEPGEFAERAWISVERDSNQNIIRQGQIAKPTFPELIRSGSSQAGEAAVRDNNYEPILDSPTENNEKSVLPQNLVTGDAAGYLDEKSDPNLLKTSWTGASSWEAVLEKTFGRSDITVTFNDDGIGVLTDPEGEPIGFIRFLDGRKNPVLENMQGELISVSDSGRIVRLDPNTLEETPIDYKGYINRSRSQSNSIFNVLDYQVTAVLSDISGIVSAIKDGKPLPILASGVHLINDLVNPLDPTTGTRIPTDSSLNTFNNVVGGLQSLYNLQNAFKNGDTLDKITATASTVNFVNSTVYQALNDTTTGAFNSSLNSFLNGSAGANGGLGLINGSTPGVLPVLSLINGIRSGDPVGIAQGLIGVINPAYLSGPVGWGLMAVQILRVIFADEPPEAWGTAKVMFDGAYGTQIDVVGEAFGKDRVRNMQQVALDYLNGVIGDARNANPNDPLGIIPQRMPTLTWRERRQSDPGYAIMDIDPVTGTQRFPYLRYDDNGMPFSADPSKFQVDPTDPQQRIPFQQALVYSALTRQAIAPMWEVKTAKMQQDAGDPNAGLSEEERFGKAGLSAPVDPNTNKRDPGHFRPIVMDMNGNGQIDAIGKAASGVTFDWDVSGFQKKTGWTAAGEGFLFLDRNPNGQADSGKELFSNSLLSDAAKGVRSMSWIDGNADGKITDLDPVFNELKVWQDDGDGVLEEGEAKKLADLGITEVDYQMGRFTRNGQYYAMSSPELEADSEGTKVSVSEAGIRVESTNGEIKLYITRVSSFTAGDDGVAMPEDGDTAPRTTPVPAVIAASLLLSNDEVNGINTGLNISTVGGAINGTVALVNDPIVGQAVYFTPNANYNGPASFQYTVTAPNGMTRTATVAVAVTPVNDLPTAYDQKNTAIPVYGYGTISYTVNPLSESPATYTMAGEPIYQPYVETVNTPIYGIVWGAEGPTQGIIGYDTSYVPHYTQIATETPTSGQVIVSDPDGPAQVRYEVISQAVYGKATVDPGTGNYSYVGRRPAGVLAPNGMYINPDNGQQVSGNIDSNRHAQNEETFTDMFTVRVYDLTDPTGHTFIDQNIPVTHYGPRPLPEVQDGGGKKPIAIDLNGDGFHFSAVDDSNVFFDVNGDGWKRKIAWNNPHDGFLAFDRNSDGKIDRFDEISFVPYKPDGQTDLEGLRAFDTNKDGVFSAADADWSKFGVWQDANSNGLTDAGEFKSLDQIGIQSIALTSDGRFQVVDGQTVHGAAIATKTDGSTLAIADVTLEYRNITRITKPDGTTVDVPVPRHSQGEVFNGTAEKDLVFGTTGSDRFVMGDGDDTVVDDAGNDVVEAGAGNDLIYTGNDNDVIDAGTGDDIVFAGNGNDLVFGGDGNDLVMGENGNDVVFGGDGNDFISGGAGNDTLSGNAGDDKLVGEDGYDALFGQEGNDELYGNAGNDLLYGGDGNDILDGGAGDDHMEGDAGDDIYVIDSNGDEVVEAADAGTDAVMSSISYTLGANLENLTLTGTADLSGTGNVLDNVLVGNSGKNTLVGGAGNDILDGGAGADTMVGGIGNDVYVVDNAGDILIEDADEGIDTVRSRIDYTLGANVENLILIGIDSIDGTGNAMDNIMIGNAASNRIDGGTGADEMRGGRGNDTYVVDQAGDQVIEAANEGIDTVEASIDYTLTANVENLKLTGAAVAGNGNELDNVLLGNERDNILDGGTGADLMAGGLGNDTYIVDNINDVVAESAAGGIDTVISGVSYRLSANVENLTLTGDAADGVGNELGNLIIGNAGANHIDGGAGADRMQGGGGDDIYIVDDVGDVIVEAVGEGTDTVLSSVSYALSANVENLTLTGNADLAGTGNELDNRLFANSGNSVLLGMAGNDTLQGGMGNDLLDGGTGIDALAGGLGDDAYVVDDTNDTVTEFANEGEDLILSSVSYELSAHVENLTLTGNGNLVGTGNELDNILTANDAGNSLYGMDGNDVLTGGSGADVLDGGTGMDRMQGGEGDDVYIVDDYADQVIETSGAGMDTVRSSIDYALTPHVENLVLTGDAIRATGNDLANIIDGNASDNLIDGREGADAMRGGAGNDTYIVDNGGDSIVENMGEGIDTVLSGVSYSLAANVENLVLTGNGALTGSGNELDNVLTANDAGNALYGLSGNDRLQGGAGDDLLDGGEGADDMRGGIGNDIYIVDNVGDFVTESAYGGDDTVRSSINYVLPDHVERLVLTDFAQRGFGNALDNTLTGNAQDNYLDGASGADVMVGGQGSDIYIVDNAGDSIIERSEEGTDTVYASVSYGLSANVENLSLTGSADLTAIGNELVNVLQANSGNSTLLGMDGDDILIGAAGNDLLDGGSGADAMRGGGGNDTYIVENIGDSVVENPGAGIDTVLAGIDYSLTANVENLILTGAADLNGAGNELDNIVTGNDGANTLYGMVGNDILIGGDGNDLLIGGSGNDTLFGGEGNDTYRYDRDDGLDYVAELSGSDTIRFGAGLSLDNLALRVVTVDGRRVAQIRVLDDNGNEQSDQGIDFNVSVDAYGRYVSPIEHFVLDDGRQLVFDDLLIKQTTIYGTVHADNLQGDRNDNTVFGNNNDDVIRAGTGNDILYGDNGDDLLYGGGGNDQLYGGNGKDALYGEGGNDLLDGANGDDLLIDTLGNNTFYGGNGSDYIRAGDGNDLVDADGDKDNGNDVVQAGGGDDLIYTGNGNDLVDAGAGDDRIDSGNGNDWIAAGKGNDVIDVGQGKNVVAFNRGDGHDTLINSTMGNDTISLGGIRYADLKLAKSGDDLRLDMGDGESITLSNWYAAQQNHGVGRLQVVTIGTDYDPSSSDKTRNKEIEIFDFTKIVQRFDAARATNEMQENGWQVMNSLLDAHLSGSQTQAIGGDLSFQYATSGDLAGIGLAAAQSSLSNPADAQTLKTRQQLEQGAVRLA